MELVKGMNRRVVVIKSPDRSLFEEAIFIVREDALHRGITGQEIVREAQRVANEYAAGRSGRSHSPRLPIFICAAVILGGLAALAFALGVL